jgi:copper chaperone CopZ
MKTRLKAVLFALPLVLSGCDEDDAVSIQVRLKDDGSGTFTVSGMTIPTEAARVETAAKGVTFDRRVEISAATGRFTTLTGTSVADITFSAGEGDGGFRFVKVIVPQGVASQWPDTFVPFDERARLDAAGALDPSGKSKDIGSNLKVVIELPAPGIGNGVTGKVRGTRVSIDGSTATLLVPIQGSRGGLEPLVWHLTWQK